MRFGTAKDLITPVIPTMLSCTSSYEQTYRQIHDDLFVRCLAMDDGNKKAVLMSFDLIFHDRTLNDALTSYAEKTYGIAPSAFVITHTHAHTTPATPSYNRYHPMHRNEAFECLLLERARACLDRAMLTMFEGTVEYGRFDADFNVSRRGKVNGVYKIHPNPDYVCDKEFFMLRVKDTEGRLRCLFCNYPCHPVFYPTKDQISSEFPGRLSALLECRHYGTVALYTQSSAGDVRPRDTVIRQEDGSLKFTSLSFDHVDAFAKGMADAVDAFLERDCWQPLSLSIASDAFVIPLPIEPAPISAFEACLEKQRRKNIPGNPDWGNALHALNGGYDDLPELVELHAQTLRLGDSLYVAAVGGEPCFGVKNAVKRAFGDKDVCFIGYTDDCAYLVDDRVLSEGGYEPGCFIEYNLKGPFRQGLDRRYTEGFAHSLARL